MASYNQLLQMITLTVCIFEILFLSTSPVLSVRIRFQNAHRFKSNLLEIQLKINVKTISTVRIISGFIQQSQKKPKPQDPKKFNLLPTVRVMHSLRREHAQLESASLNLS